MKRNTNTGLWLSILVTVIIITLKIPTSVKFALIGVFILGLLFFRRSIIYYIQANRKIVNGSDSTQWDKAWPLYRRAIKAGLQKPYVITAASMFLQRGDVSEGKKIIEEYLAGSKGKDANLDNIARIMVSMAYWMEGDVQKAIKTVEDVYASGYRDRNLYINYSTYLLENGDFEQAQQLLDEAWETQKASPGIQDNRGWVHLLKGEWEEAEQLYSQLVGTKPHFPEPYVHYAQVLIHFGEAVKAADTLEGALQARFLNSCSMRKETIQGMIDGLRDPQTRVRTAKEIDSDPIAVSSGKAPKSIEGTFESCDHEVLPNFAVRAQKPKQVEKKTKAKYNDDDERLPNTELTEEDLEYIRKHNLET